MSTKLTLILIGTCLVLQSCTDLQGGDDRMNAAVATATMVPDLPERTASVGLPGEADQLRATHAKLKALVTKDPSDLKTWLKLSEVFITEARITGNYGPNQAAALEILDRVLDKTKGNDRKDRDLRGEALTLKALVKLSQHQFEDALALGKEAVQLDPHRAFNYGVLVDANVELGHYDEAVKMSDKMVGTRPDLRSYSRVSYLREIYGDVPGAIQAMELAVKAGYPGAEETSWSRVQLGGIHERYGDLKKADEQYQLALAERPDYPFALAAAGRVAGKQKSYVRAEELLNKAIARMPDAHFLVDLARVLDAQGKKEAYAEAIRKAEDALIGTSLKKAEATDVPANSHGHSHEVGLEMARFELEFHKDLPVALANAEHEFEHRENNIDVNATLAAILYAQGAYGAATTHLDMAKSTGSKSAEILLMDGLLTAANGMVEAGRKLVKQAFAKDPYLQHAFAGSGRAML